MGTLKPHAVQRTIIQQYGDWYTGRWWVSREILLPTWVGCCIWYSEEGPGRAATLPSPLLAVRNVTAHPSTASIPTSYYLMWHYNSARLGFQRVWGSFTKNALYKLTVIIIASGLEKVNWGLSKRNGWFKPLSALNLNTGLIRDQCW